MRSGHVEVRCEVVCVRHLFVFVPSLALDVAIYVCFFGADGLLLYSPGSGRLVTGRVVRS
jgi:hypothetical protein